jgi:hypothetical protein
MNIIPRGSLSGEYSPTFHVAKGDIEAYSVVIVNAFGFREDASGNKIPGPMNEALAAFTDEHFAEHAILISPDVAPALQTEPDLIFDLHSTTGALDTLKDPKTTGTAGELLQARAFMLQEDYDTAIIVAHAFHVA